MLLTDAAGWLEVREPLLLATAQFKLAMVPGHWPAFVHVATPLQLVKTCPLVPPAGMPLAAVVAVFAVFAEDEYKAYGTLSNCVVFVIV